MNKRTFHTIQISLGRNLVSPAALILVAVRNVLAAAISAPLALAVHRLAAARLGALLQSIRVGAGIPVVQSRLAHPVHATSLILVVCVNVVALIVCVPCTHAVHWLHTLLTRALLVVMRVGASMPVVHGLR